MEKLISIIVPVYNVEPYLERCINSILGQTYANLEILLINDGSTDNSGVICDEYAKKDTRIKVVHKNNGGVSSARNLGLEVATGEYIGFIDSDDYIEPTMFEELYNKAKTENADMAICGFKQVHVNGITKVNNVDFTISWEKENIIKNYFTQGVVKELMYAPVNKLYKKTFIGNLRFCEKYRMGEDILFLFQCIEKMNKIACVDGVFYNYVMRENSAMTSPFSQKRLEYIYAIREIENICIEKHPYAVNRAKEWVYKHVLNTLRQIIVANKCEEYKEFYKENKLYLKKEIKTHKKSLSINQRVDYFLIMHAHWLLKLKIKLSA